MTTPRATVRLQLHRGFTLHDALAQVDYYAALGISHLYLSPVARARAGSAHGYDVTDHAEVNPELGGEPALRALAAALRQRGMGIVLDIVPNHMAAHWDNAWWRDVLAHGRRSRYAEWFDIDWLAADPWLRGRVLAPTLARPYAEALAAGEIRLQWDEPTGAFCIEAGGRYPLAPGTLDARAGPPQALRAHDSGDAAGRRALHALLQRQHYRLAWWPSAAEQINWRRFFEISELVGVRVERPAVFAAVHALTLRLYAEGLIDGVRVDHVDGLAEPGAYCRRLRAALRRAAAAGGRRGAEAEPYIVVEKILAEDETLPAAWQVDGTTGYDFMEDAGALLHAASAHEPLREAWQRIGGDARPTAEQLEAARRLMLTRHFAAEAGTLLRVLARLARADPAARDCAPPALERALVPWLTAFPVYRTYGEPGAVAQADQAWCQAADRRAREMARAARAEPDPIGDLAADCVARWLGSPAGPSGPDNPPEAARLRRRAQAKLRHLTPPLAAKALEDTYFYRDATLLSRNEVGAAPTRFALSPAALHERLARRAHSHPRAMLATATHDHKRGEDVRARLAVISEMPQDWLAFAEDWLERAAQVAAGASRGASPPHPGDLYALLQTLVGAWPPGLAPADADGVAAFLERVGTWQVKALREAKLRSNWLAPAPGYEAACAALLQALGRQAAPDGLLGRAAAFAQRLCLPGMVNGLVQTALRLTAPGVPDLYQGTECWDYSLVDPDNRRPVDYVQRRATLAACTAQVSGTAVVSDTTRWQDGTVKQALVRRLLALRAELPDALQHGDYQPLPVDGPQAGRVLAYARHARQGAGLVVCVLPRACALRLAPGGEAPASLWRETRVHLPPGGAGLRLRDVMTGAAYDADEGALRLAALLAHWPLAVLAGTPD